MKKLLTLILAISLVLPASMIFGVVGNADEAKNAYYVSQSGNDQNLGTSVDAPFATLAAAVDALDGADGTIYIMDTVYWSENINECLVPSYEGTITFEGLSADNVENQIIDYSRDTSANATTASLHLQGDCVFKNVTFLAHHYKSMYTNGYSLRLEGNISYQKGVSGSADFTLTLGKYAAKAENASVYLGAQGLTIGTLNIGHNVSSSITGDTQVIIDGTDIKKVAVCGSGSKLNNLDITHIKGEIGKFVATSNKTATISGVFRLVTSDGQQLVLENPANITPAKTYEYSCEKGVAVSPVGDSKTYFAVESDITVVATNVNNGKKYYSSKGGYLGIPEGSYKIAKSDVDYYTNDGETIKILKDTAISFDDFLYRKQNDKIFVGWCYEGKNEGPKSGQILPAGTVLKATYRDVKDDEFSVVGVQIRPDGNSSERSLRFVVNKDNSIDEKFKVVEYGALVLPEKLLGGDELSYEGRYSYKGISCAAGKITSPKTYKPTDKGQLYTLCITDISPDDHNTFYTARAYALCEDSNGRRFSIYSNSVSSSLVSIARHNAPVSENDKQVFESLISDWKNTYFGGGVTKAPTKHYPDAYIVDETGVSVREITVDSGKNDGKTVQIAMITDSHLNTNIPGHTEALQKALVCANFADQIVLCGDNVESASSAANMELLQKNLWDVYPQAIAVLGNHEYFYKGSGTVDAVKEKVDAMWPHDPNYYSKLIADKVLVVTADNARQHDSDNSIYYFTADKVEKLEKDIALAREKGYTILFFCHVSLASLNKSYEANAQMYELVTSSADVIKACFSGHGHTDNSSTLNGSYVDAQGNTVSAKIPYYWLRGCAEDEYKGHVLFINVK